MYIQEKDLKKAWMPDVVLNKLWNCYSISKDPRLLDQIVKGMLPLVEYVMRRNAYQNYESMEWEDIYSYGVIGLMEAIQRYNPERNPNFTRYAHIRIQGAVYDGIIQFRGLRRNYLRKRRMMMMQVDQARQEYLKDMQPYDIAEKLGVKKEEYLRLVCEEQGMNILSLDSIDYRDGSIPELQTSEGYIEDLVMQNKAQHVLQNAISRLSDMEQKIIYMHYYQGIALREIGRRIGYSHSWITKMHKTAMEKLKNMKIREILDK